MLKRENFDYGEINNSFSNLNISPTDEVLNATSRTSSVDICYTTRTRLFIDYPKSPLATQCPFC
jgi:hypothetical protein